MSNDTCIILTSVDDKSVANKLAHGLVEARLAACVQISCQGQSVYRWQGKIHNETEYYLNIKTSIGSRDAAIAWLSSQHPYDVPEIVWLDGQSADAYGAWLYEQT